MLLIAVTGLLGVLVVPLGAADLPHPNVLLVGVGEVPVAEPGFVPVASENIVVGNSTPDSDDINPDVNVAEYLCHHAVRQVFPFCFTQNMGVVSGAQPDRIYPLIVGVFRLRWELVDGRQETNPVEVVIDYFRRGLPFIDSGKRDDFAYLGNPNRYEGPLRIQNGVGVSFRGGGGNVREFYLASYFAQHAGGNDDVKDGSDKDHQGPESGDPFRVGYKSLEYALGGGAILIGGFLLWLRLDNNLGDWILGGCCVLAVCCVVRGLWLAVLADYMSR